MTELAKEDKKVGYIVVTADKGMAGAYNHNVIKIAHDLLEENSQNRFFVLGELGRQYFAREGLKVDTHFHFLLHFRLGKTDFGKGRTEGSTQRQFPFELILRLNVVQGDKAYNNCCNNFPDHLTSFRVTLKSL